MVALFLHKFRNQSLVIHVCNGNDVHAFAKMAHIHLPDSIIPGLIHQFSCHVKTLERLVIIRHMQDA